MRRAIRLAVASGVLLLAPVGGAQAEPARVAEEQAGAPATLAAAEKAYAEVDFERCHALSRRALGQGGHAPEATVRLYTLLGISAAALGNEDEARDAFRRVLAIDPETRLDQNLSPRLRAPYLEARGSLATGAASRPLEARLDRDGQRVALLLHDPAAATRTLVLEIEPVPPNGASPRKLRFAAKARTVVAGASLPARFHFTLSALDEYGNLLYDSAPALAEQARSPARSLPAPTLAGAVVPDRAVPDRTPYFVTAGVLATLGVGAVGAGALAQLRRDDAAREWNGASCEQPGQTRGQQCADVDATRKTAETWAVGLYAAGGALIIGSLVTLALVPDTPVERSASNAPSCVPSLDLDGRAGALCRARF